jgi:hypothetical protein
MNLVSVFPLPVVVAVLVLLVVQPVGQPHFEVQVN